MNKRHLQAQRQQQASSGFTLLEVLLALAVLAVVLASTSGGLIHSVDTARRSEKTMLAEWVLANRLVQHQLRLPQAQQSQVSLGGYAFDVTAKETSTPYPTIYELELSVSEQKQQLAHSQSWVFVPGAGPGSR